MKVRNAGAAERQFWTFEQLHPGEPVALVGAAYDLPTDVSLEAVEIATRAVVERHEILRSSFHRNGAVVEVIAASGESSSPVFAASSKSRDEAVRFARNLSRGRSIDLAQSPLLRVGLIRWPENGSSCPEGCLLVILSHHAVMDGGSLGVVARELGEALTAVLAGRAWEPSPVPTTYADVVKESERQEQVGSWEVDLSYWKEQLTAAPRPKEKSKIVADDFACHSRTVRLDEVRARQLRKVANAVRVSPTMVVLTAWSQHVLHYMGRSATVIGVPVSGREDYRKRDVVGVLMNTLPLVIPKLGGSTDDQVRAVRNIFLQGLRHRRPPFTSIASYAWPGQSSESKPVYDVMFSQGGEAALAINGASAGRVVLDEGFSEVPLSLVFVEESDGSFRLSLDIQCSEMDIDTAGTWIAKFLSRLDRMVDIT